MSKRIWNHPAEQPTGRKYWRSLSELDDTPEFRTWAEREFPQGAAMMADEADAGQSRRDFMKLMGAATALAGFGLASCRRPETKLVPYSKNVEWVIPGKALYYASVMPRTGGATPLVVTTFEGRPTHLQGNALHPESNGSLDQFAQSSVLDLYDPDRARDFIHAGKVATRDEFLTALDAMKAEWAKSGGKGLAFLFDEVQSPTRNRLMGKVKAKFPQARVFRYEAFGHANATAATEAVFGKGVVQVPHFSPCSVILSLDNDFLDLDRPKASSVSKFMSGRRAEKPGDPMNRLYVLESRYTVTGGMADHRLRVHASQTMKVAVALAKEIATATGDAGLTAAANAVKLTGDYKPRADYDVWIREAAKDLASAKNGKALVLAGPLQPVEVHALVAAINQALGAFAKAADKPVPPLELKQAEATDAGTLADLVAAAKEISTLAIVSAADPAFDAPSDLKWADVQKAIPNVIHLGTRHRTATSRLAKWQVPGTHYLEQWGDVRSLSGVYSVVQPMIQPLFGGMSDLEFLALVAQDTPAAVKVELPPPAAPMNGAHPEESTDPGYLAVRETFATLVQGDSTAAWNQAVRDGFLKDSVWPAFSGTPNGGAIAAALAKFNDAAPAPTEQSLELTLVPDSKVWDGRYINNGWLQEVPDSVTKVTWDNVAQVSVRTATALKLDKYTVDEAQVIELTIPGVEKPIAVPVIVAPGHADNAITISLGYGQEDPGRVGEGTGVNLYPARTTAAPYWISGVKLTVTGKRVPLGRTQEHSTMYGRELVREGTAERYKENANFAAREGADSHLAQDSKGRVQDYTFYKQTGTHKSLAGGLLANEAHLFDKQHQWGMVIDLNTCIGCTSCTLACQSENNIPIVGKRQVIIGREMHWIRMDRYFAVDLDGGKNKDGEEWEYVATAGAKPGGAEDDHGHGGHGEAAREREIDDPEMLFQPMACQHCEAAPCETVCPVNATVHSEDGLNLMVYNRCIGTRYCANNCPYKARRFNYFDYNKRDPLLASDGKSRDNANEKEGFFDIWHQNNIYLGPLAKKNEDQSTRLQRNPNVTVRMRGVIEKCTYCIQRIETAKIERKKISRVKAAETGLTDDKLTLTDDDLRIPTDKVKTACQQACPADAIVFGNLLDNTSRVSQLRGNKDIVGDDKGVDGNPRNYQLLRYLGIRPRTSYLARIKNPNPALVAASPIEKRKVGQATANMK